MRVISNAIYFFGNFTKEDKGIFTTNKIPLLLPLTRKRALLNISI